MATIFEAMRIIQASDQNLSCSRSNTRYGSRSNDTRICLADLFELLNYTVELAGNGIELGEFKIEFAFPEFVERTF